MAQDNLNISFTGSESELFEEVWGFIQSEQYTTHTHEAAIKYICDAQRRSSLIYFVMSYNYYKHKLNIKMAKFISNCLFEIINNQRHSDLWFSDENNKPINLLEIAYNFDNGFFQTKVGDDINRGLLHFGVHAKSYAYRLQQLYYYHKNFEKYQYWSEIFESDSRLIFDIATGNLEYAEAFYSISFLAQHYGSKLERIIDSEDLAETIKCLLTYSKICSDAFQYFFNNQKAIFRELEKKPVERYQKSIEWFLRSITFTDESENNLMKLAEKALLLCNMNFLKNNTKFSFYNAVCLVAIFCSISRIALIFEALILIGKSEDTEENNQLAYSEKYLEELIEKLNLFLDRTFYPVRPDLGSIKIHWSNAVRKYKQEIIDTEIMRTELNKVIAAETGSDGVALAITPKLASRLADPSYSGRKIETNEFKGRRS